MRPRRILALVLVTSLFGSTAESLLADVHDGDASAAELAAAGGPSGVCPEGVAEHASPAGETGHSTHVCHFGHAHGSWIGTYIPPIKTSVVVLRADPAVVQEVADYVTIP